MHLAPAVHCCIGTSGEPGGVHNEVIGWYISAGVIEGKKQRLQNPRKGYKERETGNVKPASYSLLRKMIEKVSQFY